MSCMGKKTKSNLITDSLLAVYYYLGVSAANDSKCTHNRRLLSVFLIRAEAVEMEKDENANYSNWEPSRVERGLNQKGSKFQWFMRKKYILQALRPDIMN